MNILPRFSVCLCLVTLFCLGQFSPMAYVHAAEGWQAGAAKQIITPKEPMWMSGYGGRDTISSGKLSELYAKALLLKASDQPAGLVLSLDLVGIDRTLSKRIRQAIGEKLSIPADNVLIATSHTHSGPVVGKNLATLHYFQLNAQLQKQIDDYAETLVNHCVAVAVAADKAKQACKLTWGSGSADFATNRRNNKEAEVPQVRTAGKLNGPFDHDVPVLAVRDAQDKLISILFGYACHSTVLSGYVWSADYPGYAQAALEEKHPGAVALFWAGCGADQNPLPRRTPELAQHYGERLAVAVDRVLLTTEMRAVAPKLNCRYAEVAAPLDTLPTKEQLEQQSKSSNKYESVRAKLLLEQIAGGQPISQTYPFPVSVWHIGDDIQFVALGGEVVVDYALRLKAELKSQTWVAGYAHDVMAYIPSRRVLTEGGYEGGGAMLYYGLPCHWGPEIEEVIIRQVKALATP
ncbi:MAG: neutral/alkaline non-lysosomal ceramidase N-terminal domain-containing protein [Pirellulaceae bacterium]|nr:neutral/alkaline non-lysosomal ceramidase N-terminal domain-containing protein [Pirellulaceae bacterium]